MKGVRIGKTRSLVDVLKKDGNLKELIEGNKEASDKSRQENINSFTQAATDLISSNTLITLYYFHFMYVFH